MRTMEGGAISDTVRYGRFFDAVIYADALLGPDAVAPSLAGRRVLVWADCRSLERVQILRQLRRLFSECRRHWRIACRLPNMGRRDLSILCRAAGMELVGPPDSRNEETVALMRPRKSCRELPSLSVIVPARNERGNLPRLLPALECLSYAPVEVVFVEGHSTDGTWEAMEALCERYRGPLRVRTLRQRGVGKADAVDAGVRSATGELIAILDADCTMPPERLERCYRAYLLGEGDFISGNRFGVAREKGAMRPFNVLGNRVFAWVVGRLCGYSLGDALCGTKLLRREDYLRTARFFEDRGFRDPFGDFRLLFGAALAGLGVREIAVPYRRRRYGVSNISRFRDAFSLALCCLKFATLKARRSGGPVPVEGRHRGLSVPELRHAG